MPELLDLVLARRPGDIVLHQQNAGRMQRDAAAMGKSAIRALRLNSILVRRGFPGDDPRGRLIGPAERADRSCLVGAVDLDCVVGSGPAKAPAPAFVTVRIGSRIDQYIPVA